MSAILWREHRPSVSGIAVPYRSSNMADSKPKPSKPANKTPPKSPGEPAKDKAAKRLSLESEGAGEGAAAAGVELSALEEAFRRFAVHGDARASGREMHGKNWSKLCRDCQVIDGRSVTVTDVDIVFSKIKGKSCRTITFEQFKEALEELAKKRFKDKSAEEAVREVHKLIEGKAPIISGVTKAISSPTVSRLTDTSKFTGSHKERFDPSGRGKGRAGRVDLVDESGYVPGYKHAGTYDQKAREGQCTVATQAQPQPHALGLLRRLEASGRVSRVPGLAEVSFPKCSSGNAPPAQGRARGGPGPASPVTQHGHGSHTQHRRCRQAGNHNKPLGRGDVVGALLVEAPSQDRSAHVSTAAPVFISI
ncbi:hypothetical protein R6Z07F_014841 [Ovis aries]